MSIVIGIERIDVVITTANVSDAGTDGNVYLGICGREFCCDTRANDFERGATGTFTFGDFANVRNPGLNDPRHPPIDGEDMDRFPVYIRFDQAGSSHWRLQEVKMSLNEIQLYESELGSEGIWLGLDAGAYYHLFRKDPNIQLT